MNKRQIKLSAIASHHTNFQLDPTELKIHFNKNYSSDYLKIKDLINIVYDNYIDLDIMQFS